MATLAQIKAISDPTERTREAASFIDRGTAAIADARTLRDTAIRELLQTQGPAKVAALSGLSVSQIKLIRSQS